MLALVEVVQLERLEVAKQYVAGAINLLQRVKVGSGLIISRDEIAACTLLFDNQYARPEEVD